jgi:hypothetical protein
MCCDACAAWDVQASWGCACANGCVLPDTCCRIAVPPHATPTTTSTGFHEFAEFVAEDVGTVDSGLNSMVRPGSERRAGLGDAVSLHGAVLRWAEGAMHHVTVPWCSQAHGLEASAELQDESRAPGTCPTHSIAPLILLLHQVLASNNEMVLLPVNEPTFGTPRKSQIQTYLEQNEGPGLQHLALLTHDIFATLR